MSNHGERRLASRYIYDNNDNNWWNSNDRSNPSAIDRSNPSSIDRSNPSSTDRSYPSSTDRSYPSSHSYLDVSDNVGSRGTVNGEQISLQELQPGSRRNEQFRRYTNAGGIVNYGSDNDPVYRDSPGQDSNSYDILEPVEAFSAGTLMPDPITEEKATHLTTWRLFAAVCVVLIILFTVCIALLFLHVLGVIPFSNRQNGCSEDESNVDCNIIFTENISPPKSCSGYYQAQYRKVKTVDIFIHGERTNSFTINLVKASTDILHWNFRNNGSGNIVILANTSALRCSDSGAYTFKFKDDSDNILFLQTLAVQVDGNVGQINVDYTPHLSLDGASKMVLIKAEMETGCHHGPLQFSLLSGANVKTITKTTCISDNVDNGGKILCKAVVSESDLTEVEKIKTELKSGTNLPDIARPQVTDARDIKIKDVCSMAYMTIGREGTVTCKKSVQTDNVHTEVYHQSSFYGSMELFGSVSISEQENLHEGRIEIKASLDDNILDVALKFKTAHCDDNGTITLHFSDHVAVSINITVQGMPDLSPERFENLDTSTKNMQLIYNWCPGHDVTNVTIRAIRSIHDKLDPKLWPSYPIRIDLSKTALYKDDSVEAKASIENGMAVISIGALNTKCAYNYTYEYVVSSTNASSKYAVHVSVTAPSENFVATMSVPIGYVDSEDSNVTFRAFLGCRPKDLQLIKDGLSIPSNDKITQNSVLGTYTVEITWTFAPVLMGVHNGTVLTATASFVDSKLRKRSYIETTNILVLNPSICEGLGDIGSNGCRVAHPYRNGKFITCSADKRLVPQSCPPGLKLDENLPCGERKCGFVDP